MLCGVYQLDPVNTRLTRAEEIAGRFMVMAERFCRKHHDIGWYADELCLSPKYVANVVKEVTGNTAGDCINDNLVRQIPAPHHIAHHTADQRPPRFP